MCVFVNVCGWVCVVVCVCVCVCVSMHVHVCMCVCVSGKAARGFEDTLKIY